MRQRPGLKDSNRESLFDESFDENDTKADSKMQST